MSVYEVPIDDQLGIPLGVARVTSARVGGVPSAHRGAIVAPEHAAG